MRVSIKSFKSSANAIDIYALAANGQKQMLCRFIIPPDNDFIADTEAAKTMMKIIGTRWKDIF